MLTNNYSKNKNKKRQIKFLLAKNFFWKIKYFGIIFMISFAKKAILILIWIMFQKRKHFR